MQHYLIIINPLSGRCGKRWLSKVTAALTNKNIPFSTLFTTTNKNSNHLAIQQNMKMASDVIVIGGDGLMNMVINAAIGLPLKIGLLPAGSGNDLARSLYKISHNKIAIVTGNVSTNVPLLKINDQYAINAIGCGIDTHIVKSVSPALKRLFGSVAYTLVGIVKLFTFKSPVAHLKMSTVDGQIIKRTSRMLLCAVCRGHFFGGGILINPYAQLFQPKMTVITADEKGLIHRFKCFLYLLFAKHLTLSGVVECDVQRLEIFLESDHMQLDGELREVNNSLVTVELVKQGIQLKTVSTL